MAILHDAAVWTVDADGYYRMSEQWERWVGCSPGAAAGDGWLEHLHPEDRNRVYDISAEGMEAVLPFSACFRMRHGTEWRWVRGKGIPILDATGNVVTHGVTVPMQEELTVAEVYRGEVVDMKDFADPRLSYIDTFNKIYAGSHRRAILV